jgi:hypothetical protein
MAKIINFKKFLEKKKVEKQIEDIKSRTKRNPQDFGDRLKRIRTSLERINRLMDELRELSQRHDDRYERWK